MGITIRVILLSLIFGLIIGFYFLHSQQVTGYKDPVHEQVREEETKGRYNTTTSTVLGENGELLTYIRPPTYGTADFEAYKAERETVLKVTAGAHPERTVEATITFYPTIRTSELEVFKNKYSLKLLRITGSASGSLNYSEAPVLMVSDDSIGERLGLFSRIHDTKVKAAVFDFEKLAEEPDVILVDLNINGETHAPVFIPGR